MPPSLSQKAYDYLVNKLSSGQLAPGSRLVNRTLAEESGIDRGAAASRLRNHTQVNERANSTRTKNGRRSLQQPNTNPLTCFRTASGSPLFGRRPVHSGSTLCNSARFGCAVDVELIRSGQVTRIVFVHAIATDVRPDRKLGLTRFLVHSDFHNELSLRHVCLSVFYRRPQRPT